MAGFVFNEGADSLLDGTINWAADTIRARPVLTSAEAAINKDATVMTGIGVVGFDVTLASKARAKDDTTDRVYYDAADFAFVAVTGGTGEVDHFVVYKFVTNDAASIPIAKIEMTAITPNGGDINVAIAAPPGGLFYTQQ